MKSNTQTADVDIVELTLPIPRSQLRIEQRAETVTQKTALQVLGLPPRAYLEAARRYADAGGKVTHVGKLRMVRVDPFVRWLERDKRETITTTDSDDLSAELGLRVVGGAG